MHYVWDRVHPGQAWRQSCVPIPCTMYSIYTLYYFFFIVILNCFCFLLYKKLLGLLMSIWMQLQIIFLFSVFLSLSLSEAVSSSRITLDFFFFSSEQLLHFLWALTSWRKVHIKSTLKNPGILICMLTVLNILYLIAFPLWTHYIMKTCLQLVCSMGLGRSSTAQDQCWAVRWGGHGRNRRSGDAQWPKETSSHTQPL